MINKLQKLYICWYNCRLEEIVCIGTEVQRLSLSGFSFMKTAVGQNYMNDWGEKSKFTGTL
jgi:hypothetical protein